MKLLLSLLVLLSGALLADAPPKVQVGFSPLTKAAYVGELQQQVRAKLLVTQPLKKQGGRIRILTTAGVKVFQDRGLNTDDVDQAQYEYAGYWPQFKRHMVVTHLWEHTDYLLIAATGEQLTLPAEPQFGPGLQRFVVVSSGIENEVVPNTMQLFQWAGGRFTKEWETTPEDWGPEQVAWTGAATLVLRKQVWTKQGLGYGYARLVIR